MDKFFSICAFPIGIVLTFGVIIAAWLREEYKK
jgi:hypothetical protein